MEAFAATDEQVTALAAHWISDWARQHPGDQADWIEDFRELTESPAFQAIMRSVQAETLRGVVEGFTVIATGKITPQDLLDHADWLAEQED